MGHTFMKQILGMLLFFCRYDGAVYIGESTKVAASFPDKVDKKYYDTTAYYLAKYVICCKCNCVIGAKIDGKNLLLVQL